MRFKALFLDFGETIAFDRGRIDLFDALIAEMKSAGISPPPKELILDVARRLWKDSLMTLKEHPMEEILAEALAETGQTIEREVLTSIVDKVSELPFHNPNPEAEKVLKAAKESGLKIALVSNARTFIPVKAIRRFGFEDFFDAIIISREAGFIKPSVEIFNKALKALNIRPEEAIHVGDKLYFDVCGAKRAGLSAALLGSDDAEYEELKSICSGIRPDFTISRLSELLQILELD